MSSLLMRVYEKTERQRKPSLVEQPRSAKRDQDLENAGGSETSREWCDDPDFAAYPPLARQHQSTNRDQDLNVKIRSVASRELCDDAELEAPSEPCRDNQDTVMDSAVSGGIDSSQAAAYSPLQHRNAKWKNGFNVKSPEVSREWCDGADLEATEPRYAEKFADQDMIMKSKVIGEDQSVSSQAAVVAPMNRRPGAYAVMQGRSMQHRQDDAGTTTATFDPTNVVSAEPPPITAEIVEDTQVDISSHIRRVLAENAVPACSVAAMNASKEWPDKSALAEGESSRRWRRLILVFLCLILLAVVATVVAVVVLLTNDPEPTTRVTIVIKLDDNPEETGWELHQDGNEVEAFPPGSYRGYNNMEVITKADVYTGKEYVFTLFDTGGDGIDGGYYKIYDASDTSDPEALLVEGSGNFTDQVQEDFAPVGQETNEEEAHPALQGDEEECVDCEVTDWSDWSPCSADCNGGIRSRTRTVLILGNECGNPCPPFVEMEHCNTELCPDECPHECCGDTDCQQDEKCLENQCNQVCECGCSEPYTCNVEANCQCVCPYECCKDGDCTGDKQICSGDYTCLAPTDPTPCECDCSSPYTCLNCECICPYECCKDGDCTGENQMCSGDYTCMPKHTDPTPGANCDDCPSPYTCNENDECVCLYECCNDASCAGENQTCSGDYTCMPKPTDPTPGAYCVDCPSPYSCNENGECFCSHECCQDSDCAGENYTCSCDYYDIGQCLCILECYSDTDCSSNEYCSDNHKCVIVDDCCNCTPPYTCNLQCECVCPYECCNDGDCDGECVICSTNNECMCPYECCSDDDCAYDEECISDGDDCACMPICDCSSPYICNDNGQCICPYQCCVDDDCGGGVCVSNECKEVCECECPSPYTCNDNCGCDCPYECCDDGDCGGGVCVSNECKEVCECDCPSPYTCNDDCGCDCPYECCDDGDCGGGVCVSNKCEEVCECDCPSPYTCNDNCGCDCPYECCDDGDCGGGICVSNECEEVCECDCPSPYTCNDDCGCDCPYECCKDDDCNGDAYCGSDYTCYDPPA